MIVVNLKEKKKHLYFWIKTLPLARIFKNKCKKYTKNLKFES